MDVDWMSWINLALRWLHVVTGIAWIGSSFYFIWLDNHLRAPKQDKEGVKGELWAVHGGGFYHNQKYLVAPAELPEELHWFKWEAYFTWISGFLLLAVMYYYGAELFLIDRAKADLSQPAAIAIGLAFLAGGWLVYDGLCRSPLGRSNWGFGLVWFAVLTVSAYALSEVFNDRGAYIHVGAMIGTVMAANVFMVIIPNQKKVVAAMVAGQVPDAGLGAQAKQRSLHNNYMTLPVLFIMISSHYPMTFANPYGWLVLAGLGAVGWLIRHFFNLRHVGRNDYGLVFLAVALFLIVTFFASDAQQRHQAALTGGGETTFAQARAIVERHCVNCHAAAPSHPDFDAPPGGVALERPDQIEQYAQMIYEQSVISDIMPLGNETGMTEAERAQLGAWIARHGTDADTPAD